MENPEVCGSYATEQVKQTFINPLSIAPNLHRMSEESDMKRITKTNPYLVQLIQDLKEATRTNEAPIWRDIATRLEKPRSRWAEVNLSRIELYAKDGDVIVVPGKLLGAGLISKKVTVAAFQASESARVRIENAGGRVMDIPALIAENPKGSSVRIMG